MNSFDERYREQPDQINPAHYKDTPPGIELECIEYTRKLRFSQGNAAKYVYRAGRKGETRECLAKAAWYLQDALDHGHEYSAVGWKLRNTIDPRVSVRATLFDLIVGGHCATALNLLGEVIESGADLDGAQP